ncbi:MAG: thioredoxin family protein [Planctomycetaceae bacterium]
MVFLSTECPISNGYLPRLNAIHEKYQHQKVRFFGVISDSAVTRAEAAAHRKKFKIRFPVLFDASGEVRRRFRPSHVPQAFVLDHRAQRLYCGLIDDEYAAIGRKKKRTRHHYFSNAIRAAIHGQRPVAQKTQPIGCLVEDVDAKIVPANVTYCRDIAPIIQAHCITCHRPGEAAPFPLLSFQDVAKHSRQIVAVTQAQIMPPWKPQAGFGHFRNERRLSKHELSLLAAWSKGGKAYGKPADLPPARTFQTGWQLGKPDLILEMPKAFRIPSRGADVFRHFVLPTGLRQHRMIAAIEFRPGNPRVAHHCSIFIDNTGSARKLDALSPGQGYSGFGGPGFLPMGSLGNWLPGSVPQRLPEQFGRILPSGTDIILQMHYQCTGKPEFDRSKIGLYFASQSARQLVSEFQVMNTTLKIPAGAKRFYHRATYQLPVDVTLFDAAPHMHLIGREMKVTAISPGGKTTPLIWIRDWDFNWQGQYSFAKPLKFRRGTRIIVEAWLDNSDRNLLNPNSPPKPVVWGDQTADEMPLCQFRYTTRNLRDFRKMQVHYLRYLLKQMKRYYPNTP